MNQPPTPSGNQPLDRFKMETNFEGLIQLLAKSLYPDPDVFVRELIQNGHDSIIRRQTIEPDIQGKIDIKLDIEGRTITFKDNGIGMNAQDIKQFLSVIGSTGTGTAKQALQTEGRSAALNLIGQFGIGMLSAFVVAEKVVVTTQKVGSEAAFAWHNYGSTDCELYPAELSSPGSEIVVSVNPDYLFMLDEQRIREAIVKYCDFIPFAITLHGTLNGTLNGEETINAVNAPWHRTDWASEPEKIISYKQFLNRRYPDVPLDVIPIDIREPFEAKGALYITNRRIPDVNTTGVVDIFVRRMFVRADDNTLLPPWAKFVRGIIDSPDLQPTAARDNIQRKHPSFEFFQQHLGELIVNRLAYLAQHEPSKFQKINLWHHYHLKGMAYYHHDFFEQVADLLLFETNMGDLSLEAYLQQNASKRKVEGKTPIYYFAHTGGSAQFYKLAAAKGWIVINAGYQFDEAVLEKYAHKYADTVYLERLDATDDPELFQRLDGEEIERFRALELDMEKVLRTAGLGNVLVQMRRFDPDDLPAVVIVSAETESEENLRSLVAQSWFMEGMEEIATESLKQSRAQPIYLSLNVSNPLIQKLAAANRQSPVVQQTMLGLYNSAILYSHNLLNPKSIEIMHGQFISFFNTLITHWETTQDLEKQLWAERRLRLSLQMSKQMGEQNSSAAQTTDQTTEETKATVQWLSYPLLQTLRLQLAPEEAEQLMTHYATVDALLQAAPAEVADKAGIQAFIVQAIQGELHQMNSPKQDR